MRALTAEAALARRNRSHACVSASSLAERWQAWCTATATLLTGICEAEEARLLLERRYLDGHVALFPEAIKDWERLRENAKCLASLGGALPPLPVGRRRAPRSAEIEALVSTLMRSVPELARKRRHWPHGWSTRHGPPHSTSSGTPRAPPRWWPDGFERVPKPRREPTAPPIRHRHIRTSRRAPGSLRADWPRRRSGEAGRR